MVDCEGLLKSTADADYEWHYHVKMPMSRTATTWMNLYEQFDQSAAFRNSVLCDVKWNAFAVLVLVCCDWEHCSTLVKSGKWNRAGEQRDAGY